MTARRRPRPDDPAIAAARARFGRARDDRQSEIAEDYVELIDDLIRAHGEARATDIARSLGVSHVTVIRTLARLARDGLAVTEPYASVTLTEAGRALAARVRQRHAVVEAFLRAIGVDETTARQDAEGMEHHVSEATLAAMQKFIEKS
jgi:DtxR family manganese transport transcriptional regulator